MTRLRVSSHRLEIESGRWNKPRVIPLDRKCKNCSILEDEIHFILESRLYTELRTKYIKKYYWKRQNIPKFIALFNMENETQKSIYVYFPSF